MKLKTCFACNKLLPQELFSHDASTSDGYEGRCKKCASIKNKSYKARKRLSNYVPLPFGRKPNTAQDFWRQVDIKSDNECWEFVGSHSSGRYGRVKYQSTQWLTHRLAYFLSFGPIPDNMEVCHKCDNPHCCNPKHLWIGTTAANAQDRASKGRNHDQNGERNSRAKLTSEQVQQIRTLYDTGSYMQKDLAKMFSVGNMQISRIVRRKRWNH